MPKEDKSAEFENEYRLTRTRTTETVSASLTPGSSGPRKTRRMSSVVSQNSGTLPMLKKISSTSSTGTLHKRLRSAPSTADGKLGLTSDAIVEERSQEEQEAEKRSSSSVYDLEAGKVEAPSKKENAPLSLRLRYKIWLFLHYLSKYEFKVALKMALAMLLLSFPAFIPSSTAWYESVRGQWSCMTVIAIMNPTSGGTVHASLWRIVGTFIGACVGWAALEANGGQPYLLALFGVLLCKLLRIAGLCNTHLYISPSLLLDPSCEHV